jgi:hypothetical protein
VGSRRLTAWAMARPADCEVSRLVNLLSYWLTSAQLPSIRWIAWGSVGHYV